MGFEILGVDLYHILSWFIVYSFMGWIWESCYVSAKSKKWVNRGFVSGPFVTIYGVGAVTVYVILRPVAGNILELYFAGVAVATDSGICDRCADGSCFSQPTGGITAQKV